MDPADPRALQGAAGGGEAGVQASCRASPSARGRSAAPLQSDRETEASPLPPPPHRARGLPGRVSRRARVADPWRERTQPENRGSEPGGCSLSPAVSSPGLWEGLAPAPPEAGAKPVGQGHVPGPPPAKRGPRGPVRGLSVEGRLVVKVLPSRELVSEPSPQRQTGLWSSLEVGGRGGPGQARLPCSGARAWGLASLLGNRDREATPALEVCGGRG